jgi:hypothetical protein
VKKRVRQQLSQRRGQKRQQAYSASDDAEPAELSDGVHYLKTPRHIGAGV